MSVEDEVECVRLNEVEVVYARLNECVGLNERGGR